MRITRASITQNRITVIVLAIIIFSGLSTFLTMPRSEDPGFTIRTAAVVTFFPGASPERVEMLVTDKIEKVVQEIPELDFVNSESKTGQSFIFVNIKESEKHMRPIWDNLRRKVEAIRDLPDGVIGPFVNDEYGDVFGIIIGITADGYEYSELKKIADQVREEMLNLPDAAKVNIAGAQDERIFIEYDNARLAQLGLTTLQLQQLLSSRNILISGGSVKVEDQRLVLEPSGNFESVEELRGTLIPTRSGRPIYLEDIAEVTRGYVDPPQSLVRVSNQKGLTLGISLREGGNIISLGEQVEAKLTELRAAYPIGVDFDIVAYQHRIVDQKVKAFVVNLLQAIGVVMFVLLLILGIRTGLIVASLIPVAIIMSLMMMGWFRIGLDTVSLAALIIALGMLVDNAIVMSESIMVRLQTGTERMQAVLASAKELAISLLTSSLTTSAAFLPIFLAESTTGEYTASLFKVVTITLLCSWLLSLTMIPMFCYYFLKVKPKASGELYSNRFYRWYRRTLVGGLRKPWLVLGIAILAFYLSIQGLGLIPSIFFPESDRNLVVGSFELPIGTDIEKTYEVVTEIEKFIDHDLKTGPGRVDGVENWVFWIGGNTPKYALSFNPKGNSPEKAELVLNTSSHEINEKISSTIETFCAEHFPDMKAVVNPISLGPPVSNPVEIRLKGKDAQKLFTIVDQVKAKLSTIPGATTVADDWGSRTQKLNVNIDQAKARNANLSSQDIAISLQTALSGMQTGEYREGDEVIPIVMRQTEAGGSDLDRLASINIFSQSTGQSVPLQQVADVEMSWEASKILRRDRFKTVTVSCQVEPGYTPENVEAVLFPWAEEQVKDWGLGYSYEAGGTRESSGEANASIGEKVPIAFMIILLLLITQFNSMRKSLIIVLCIPLGMIGVTFGLLVAHSYMGFMTFLGVISLAGIVINNAIVLIDTIGQNIADKQSVQDALVMAGISRFRPILLTTCTTAVGLIPLWLGGGPMFEPMAIAIIFGLIFATLITLYFVPVMYKLFYRVSFRGYGG